MLQGRHAGARPAADRLAPVQPVGVRVAGSATAASLAWLRAARYPSRGVRRKRHRARAPSAGRSRAPAMRRAGSSKRAGSGPAARSAPRRRSPSAPRGLGPSRPAPARPRRCWSAGGAVARARPRGARPARCGPRPQTAASGDTVPALPGERKARADNTPRGRRLPAHHAHRVGCKAAVASRGEAPRARGGVPQPEIRGLSLRPPSCPRRPAGCARPACSPGAPRIGGIPCAVQAHGAGHGLLRGGLAQPARRAGAGDHCAPAGRSSCARRPRQRPSAARSRVPWVCRACPAAPSSPAATPAPRRCTWQCHHDRMDAARSL
jgi:hypothetical protein